MPHRMLIKRLLAAGGLSDQDQGRLAAMPHMIREFKDAEVVVWQGDRATQCVVVMTGILSRQRVVGDRNQISSFYVPGDITDLHTLHRPVADHALASVGDSVVAFIPHSYLRQMLMDSPSLTSAFWRETLIHAAIYQDWIENLGARPARAKLAHLICELAARLEMVGLLDNDSFRLPLKQQDLADACGLSTVHVNRTLQELRRTGLIEWRHQTVRFLGRRLFEETADFRSDYLHAGEVTPPPMV